MTQAAVADDPVQVEPGWGQGRATFGGVIGALLVARMRGLLDDPRPLRSVGVQLAAPVVGGPVQVEAQIVRQGRSVTLVQAVLRQDGAVAATGQAAFGASRPSSVTVPAGGRLDRPAFPPAGELPELPNPPGTPEFFRHVDFRLATGALPFSGAAEPDFGGWMRWREPVPGFNVEHLVALIDTWPPAMTPLLPGPAPVSTLTWTIELFTEEFTDDWWQYRVHTDACAHGYGHAGAHVWNAAGELAAISRQTVTVFD